MYDVKMKSRTARARARARLLVTMTMIILILMYITLRARIANLLVTGSRCRGGIVNIQGGGTRARIVRPTRPTALWRFRVRTSNSPSDHSRPHPYTHIRKNDRIYAQRDIRGYGDDHLKPPRRQSPNPTALWLLRVSTSNRPSDHSQPHTHTQVRQNDRIYAQRDIRGYGDDHLKPPDWQFSNPMALWRLRASI